MNFLCELDVNPGDPWHHPWPQVKTKTHFQNDPLIITSVEQVKVSVNSTNNQVKGQKHPSPQGNQVEPDKKSQGKKPQHDQIYQHHYNKNQVTPNQVNQHRIPQLHQIKQPQKMEQSQSEENGEEKNDTKREEQQNEIEKKKGEKEKEKTRVSYYPDPKSNSLSRSL